MRQRKKVAKDFIYQKIYESPVGNIFLIASDKGLRQLSWKPLPILSFERDEKYVPINLYTDKVIQQLNEYIAGQRQQFDLDLEIKGTLFQQKVWQVVAQIPYGETLSYKDVAEMIGNPKAVRAVGTAIGKNPLCLVIPCHRVLSSNGHIGGYSGGHIVKKYLLNIERK